MSSEGRAFASATAVEESSGGGGEAVPLQEVVAVLDCQDDCSCSDESSSASAGERSEEGTQFAGLILSKSGLVLNKPKGAPVTPREMTRGIDLDEEEDGEEFYDPITMDDFVRLLCGACGS